MYSQVCYLVPLSGSLGLSQIHQGHECRWPEVWSAFPGLSRGINPKIFAIQGHLQPGATPLINPRPHTTSSMRESLLVNPVSPSPQVDSLSQNTQILLGPLHLPPLVLLTFRPFPRVLLPLESMHNQLQTEGNCCSPTYFWLRVAKSHGMLIYFSIFASST